MHYFSYYCSKYRLWYSLEPPRRGGSNEYPQCMFWAETWKYQIFFFSEIFHFLMVKFSVYLNRHVFVMDSLCYLFIVWPCSCSLRAFSCYFLFVVYAVFSGCCLLCFRHLSESCMLFGVLHRISKFPNFCHGLMQKKTFVVTIYAKTVF